MSQIKDLTHIGLNAQAMSPMLARRIMVQQQTQIYSYQAAQLYAELGDYINRAKKEHAGKDIKALIAPHAGLYFSGPTAAYAYQYVTRPHQFQRVFIFGPSHHKYFPGCALTYMDEYSTPFGPLQVDIEVVQKLKKQQGFHMINIDDQQDQHSIELHLPFIHKALGNKVKIVPILTGPVDQKMADQYGKVFAPYFDDPNTLFIFSTDFCHWGSKHGFTYYNQNNGEIWRSIQKLDGEGMNHIQSHSYIDFYKYINSTGNTICGRHVLYIFLKIVEYSKLKVKTKFIKYSQSEQVKKEEQNSVSYASAITFINQDKK